MSDSNKYPEETALKDLMAKLRSGTDQEVIDKLGAPLSSEPCFQSLTLLDALGPGESYEACIEEQRGAEGEFPLGGLAFDVLLCLAKSGKKEAFEFLKKELLARELDEVPISGTIYAMDWEPLRNIDDGELRQRIVDGQCEDVFPSTCEKFSGRPYRKDAERLASIGLSMDSMDVWDDWLRYELSGLSYEDLATQGEEVVLMADKLALDSFSAWLTDEGSAEPLDPPSLYAERTRDADRFTLVPLLDPRIA